MGQTFEEGKFSHDFGCGYPSDPKSKQWLNDNFDDVFAYPTLVRFSWKTAKDRIENAKANFDFKDPQIANSSN